MIGFNNQCPNCSEQLKVKQLACDHCGLELNGDIQLPRLARFTAEEREFIELFVLSSGSLKQVGNYLGISYPTVRQRLNQTIDKLKDLRGESEQKRLSVLERLERGEITSQEAVKLLKNKEIDGS